MNLNPEALLAYSNTVYIVGAIVTLLGTFGIVYYTNATARLKDLEVQRYRKEADDRIAAANEGAAQAYQKGNEAYLKGEKAQAGVAGANAIAATAHAEAEKAKADAAIARAEAEKSKSERAKYETRLQEANTGAEVAKRDAANARLETERVRLEMAAMQTRFAPRVLTESQISEAVTLLLPFAGQEYQFAAAETSEEVIAFTKQVDRVLLTSKWRHVPETTRLFGGFVGMYLLVGDDLETKTGEAGRAFVYAFKKAGIEFKAGREATSVKRGNLILLQIGTKF